jgi:hypothetical protein
MLKEDMSDEEALANDDLMSDGDSDEAELKLISSLKDG